MMESAAALAGQVGCGQDSRNELAAVCQRVFLLAAPWQLATIMIVAAI